MSFIVPILAALLISSILLIAAGILLKGYSHQYRFLNFRDGLNLERLVKTKSFLPILSLLSGNNKSKRYSFSQRIITRSETEMSVHALYLLKLVSIVSVTCITLLVSLTNADVLKLSIMSKQQGGFQIFQDANIQIYSQNAALYKVVVARIGEDTLKKLDRAGKLEEIRKVLPELMGTGEREIIDEKASSIVEAYEAIVKVSSVNFQVIFFILSSYWLPELVLFIKRLLLGNRYRKEVIKLENIFELLGSIRNFKTIDILDEMAKASKTYRKCLENCRELFKTEKEQALEALKVSVKNARFSRLVDILRVYSMTDKKLAMQIMERNRLEKEEELLLTSEEDIDLVDLIAFISIVPILLQLVNLLLKPMLDMIYEAFQFI